MFFFTFINNQHLNCIIYLNIVSYYIYSISLCINALQVGKFFRV